MAQVGFTPIKLYLSTTALLAPDTANLAAGELAINTTDGILYYKNTAGSLKILAQNSSSIGTFSTITVTGSITASSNVGAISQGTLGFSDVNIWQSYQTSVNNYAQVTMQNTNAGISASTDFVVANDQGTSTTFYGNLGMNSSGFSGTGSLNAPNNVYVSATSSDLVLGTTTANAIRFVTNASATDALIISSAGASTFNFTGTFANTTGNKLVVSGNISRSAWTTTGPAISVAATTFTSTGTLTGIVAVNSLNTPTVVSAGTATATDLATLYIAAPTLSTGFATTTTNRWAIYTPFNGNGDVYIGGNRLQIRGSASGQIPASNFGATGVGFCINTTTYTSAAGMSGNIAVHSIGKPTLAATTSSTLGDSYTLWIEGAVGVGANVSYGGNPTYALYVASGSSYFGGNVVCASTGFSTSTNAFQCKFLMLGSFDGSLGSVNGVGIRINASTYNDSASSGTVAAAVIHGIAAPTITATSNTTYTNASTLYIAAAPIASSAGGGTVTFSNSYALYIAAGASYFGGAVTFNAAINASGITTNYGELIANYNLGAKFSIRGDTSVAAWTTTGPTFNITGGSYTSTGGLSGTVVSASIQAPTFDTTLAAQTVTNAVTFYIGGSPSAGGSGNLTITNAYSLYIASGNSFFGGTLVGSATLTLFNTASTTVNFAGAATTIGIGATTGTLTLNNPTVVGSQTTVNLFNTTTTTLNFAGAGTAIAIGATTGTLTLNNPTIVGSQTTATLFNTVATTVNFAGAATTMLIGTATTTNFTLGGGTASAGVINLFAGPTTGVTLNLGTALTTSSINVGTAQTTGNLILGNTASTTGQIQLRSNLALYQPAPPTTITATGALVVASMKLRIIQVTSATAVTLTPDTGTTIDAAFSGMAVDTAFEFTIINTGSAAGAVTMAVATGVTYIGSTTVAISTSGTYRARKTAANTFVMYRVA